MNRLAPEIAVENEVSRKDEGSLLLGLLVCWLLNMVYLGVAYLLFVYGEQTLPAVFVLVGGIGLLQIGYVVPIWYVLRRRGLKRMAKGFLIAALVTALINGGFWLAIYVSG
jgi:hypothetical protein